MMTFIYGDAFAGDILANGSLPALVTATSSCFRLTDNVGARAQAGAAAARAALPAGEGLLSPPVAGANIGKCLHKIGYACCSPFCWAGMQRLLAGRVVLPG